MVIGSRALTLSVAPTARPNEFQLEFNRATSAVAIMEWTRKRSPPGPQDQKVRIGTKRLQ